MSKIKRVSEKEMFYQEPTKISLRITEYLKNGKQTSCKYSIIFENTKDERNRMTLATHDNIFDAVSRINEDIRRLKR